jgi:hypothetical protein
LNIQLISFWLGLTLLVAWLVQAAVPIQWAWLETLQGDQSYKLLTGLVLMAYLGHQWYLSILRILKRHKTAKDNFAVHKLLGALAPLVFFFHSTKVGYAYLALLTTVYLGNCAVGLFNQESVRIKKTWFTNGWMFLHVGLSLMTMVLATYHLVVALAYR